jgi:hypothetical protein
MAPHATSIVEWQPLEPSGQNGIQETLARIALAFHDVFDPVKIVHNYEIVFDEMLIDQLQKRPRPRRNRPRLRRMRGRGCMERGRL